jgi:hypothetical protein
MPLSSPNCQDLHTKLDSLKLKQYLFRETLDMAAKEKTLKDPVVKEKLKTLTQEIITRQQEIETLLLPAFMHEAENILGEQNFLGSESIKKTFGFTPEHIPLIPFDKEALERAKELNQYLVLRVNATPDGTPLTMKTMNEMLKGKTNDNGKILANNDVSGNLKSDAWYKDEAFFTQETSQFSWSLVSKEVLDDETEEGNSTDKNYLKQTEVIAHYLKEKVFAGKALPKNYQLAIDEFEASKDELHNLLVTDWKEAAQKLEILNITNLTRQTPVEVLYDMLLTKQSKGGRLLESKWTWTSKRDSDGRFVIVGAFGAGGVGVYRDDPRSSNVDLGVFFPRRV